MGTERSWRKKSDIRSSKESLRGQREPSCTGVMNDTGRLALGWSGGRLPLERREGLGTSVSGIEFEEVSALWGIASWVLSPTCAMTMAVNERGVEHAVGGEE